MIFQLGTHFIFIHRQFVLTAMLLLVFYCFQLLLPFHVSSQSDFTDQCSALLEFSRSFDIGKPVDVSLQCHDVPNPKTLHWEDYYLNGTNCCEWDGITCESASTLSSHMIGIDLSCSGLQGNLHSNSTLFHLSHLQTLNLAFNNLYGSQIPPSFRELSSLTYLNLSNSLVAGEIPYEISYLFKLKSLDLSDNYPISIQEPVWKRIIGNLTKVSELVLTGVNFSSIPLPSIFMNLTSSLITLDVSACDLTGDYLRIPYLPKLETLILSNNYYLNASLENVVNNLITSTSSLKFLYLFGCGLYGKIPTSLGNLTRLSYIDLFGNNIDGSIPSTLGLLRKLSYLELAENNFNGPIPPSFGNLTQLSYMFLSPNYLRDPIPPLIGNLAKLSILDLSGNNLIVLIPSYMNLTQLSGMGLSENNLSGSIPAWLFSDRPHLESLFLDDNNLTGNLPIQVMQLQYNKLRELHLSYN